MDKTANTTSSTRRPARLRRRLAALVAGAAAGLMLAACSAAQNLPAAPAPPESSAHTHDATAAAPAAAQPSAGPAARGIKALPPERVAELLGGKGAGYALAAELNGYPGPRHVLELRAQLDLRTEQEQVARALASSMERDARALGARLVEIEAQLDAAFASGAATRHEVDRLTAEAAAVEGRLRAVHLATHLTLRDTLSPEQRVRYDVLRGYAAADAAGGAGAGSVSGHGAAAGPVPHPSD